LHLQFRIVAAKPFFLTVIGFGTVRVIALSTDVAKADFFFALTSDVEMITFEYWTSAERETSCKIIHDNYNADPLFV
jgi:hypothetical protein